jgi:E3 ubiquitin-protein ligase MYCBP2
VQYTAADSPAHVLALHLDAGRDNNANVTSIEALGGPDEDHLDTNLGTLSVHSKFVGWKTVSCVSSDGNVCKVVRLKFKSSHSKVRVRQLLAYINADDELEGSISLGDLTKHRANEALQLFRQLSMKLFGFKRAEAVPDAGEEPARGGDESQLRQQVVGLLFDKDSQLTQLQTQVCGRFFADISKQTHILVNDSSDLYDDGYLNELVGMVASLAASDAGVENIATEQTLINDLVCLLHLGSSRVQAGAIAIIRRLLLVVQPSKLATLLPKLPVSHAGEGLVPLLILAISKALDVQVRVRGQGKSVTKTTFATAVSTLNEGLSRWYQGKTAPESAHSIIVLLADTLNGEFGSEWENNARSIVVNLVKSLSVIENVSDTLAMCAKEPDVWLALGALATLTKDLVDKLSHERSDVPVGDQFLCDNHDDGSTLASYRCSECDLSLCSECDSVLHLSKRARGHTRLKLEQAESKSLVELNEGCGRARLPLLLAIADRRSLQGVIEIKAAGASSGACCRFCEGPLGDDGGVSQAIATGISNVCESKECKELALQCCDKTLPCTHACCGLRGEQPCLPCLHSCDSESLDKPLTQDHEDQCMICFTGALAEEPCIRVGSRTKLLVS